MRAAKFGTALRLAKHSIWKGNLLYPVVVSAAASKGFIICARTPRQLRFLLFRPDTRKPAG